MRRYRSPRRFVTRVSPSIRHRNPETPIPIEGCKCEQCEEARFDNEGDRIELVMGRPDEADTENRQ